MTPIYIGNNPNPAAIFKGLTEIGKVYKGNVLVWQKFTYGLWIEFKTTSSGSFTFTLDTEDILSGDLKFDMGDGTEYLATSPPTHTYLDSTEKTVRVYRGGGDLTNAIENLFLNKKNITYADLSKVDKIHATAADIRLGENSNLTDVTFANSITGVIYRLELFSTGFIGTLDLSMFDNLHATGTIFTLHSNSSITGVTFANNITGKLLSLWLYSCNITGTLDLSMFENLHATLGNIRLQFNSNLTGVTFATSITGKLQILYINHCDLTGTFDLSMFDDLHATAADIRINNNSNLTDVTFATSITGVMQRLYINHCDLTGTFDLSMFENLHATAADIRLNNNSNLTDVTFATSITGVMRYLYLYSCGLTGTLDLSMFTDLHATAFISIYSNPSLTGVTMPSATGTLFRFTAYSCDLGYIDFTGIPDALAVSGSAISLQNNNMTATEVDHILVDLASLVDEEGAGGDYTSREINIGGTNAAPTDGTSTGYDGLAAKTALEDKGISVTVTT